MPAEVMSFYKSKRYKTFLKSLSSYEQKKEFIEIIGEAIQYGISMLSGNLKKRS